jgi:hypothetical protein
MSELGATIEDLVRTLKARRVRVPAEIGTFVALECAERLLEGPAIVTMRDVRLSEDGFVSLFVTPHSATGEASAQSLVSMLASLLVAAGTAVPTPLIGIVESGGPTGPDALAELRDELEAALVPLNRQAARRVLSRMIREARRPATERPPAPTEGGLDDAIDALLGDDPTQERPLDGGATARYPATFDPGPAVTEPRARAVSEPPPLPRSAPPPPLERSAPELGRSPEPEPRAVEPRAVEPRAVEPRAVEPERPAAPRSVERAPEARAPEPRSVDERPRERPAPRRAEPAPSPEHEDGSRRKPRPIELADDLPPPSRGGGVWLVLGMILAGLAVGALVLARQRPELIDQVLGRPSADELPDAAVPLPPPVEAGTLEVTSNPSGAQVFLFVGRGPTVIDELPMGVAHEFVVIADGHQPQRVIVAPDASWETTSEGRRYELAAQAGPALEEGADPALVSLGPSLMPREPGTPGELGSVRVITNPPGAKVYMLIGFTPDVHVENLPTDEAHELLVWTDGHRVERVVVGPSDWQGEGSDQTAAVSATLVELPRRR